MTIKERFPYQYDNVWDVQYNGNNYVFILVTSPDDTSIIHIRESGGKFRAYFATRPDGFLQKNEEVFLLYITFFEKLKLRNDNRNNLHSNG